MKTVGHLVLEQRTLAAGQTWRPEGDVWTVLRVQAGDGYLFGSGAPRPLGDGELVVTNGAATCELRASQLGPLRLHYFLVRPPLLSGVMSGPQIQALVEQSPTVGARHFPAGHATAREFGVLVEHGASGDAFLARCRMLELGARLLAETAPATPTAANSLLTAQARFERLIQALPEAELVTHKPQQLAKRCGCSVRHFSRLFRQQFRCSLLSRQIEVRLRKAQQLLRETDAKVIDVALDSGFQHVGLFNAMFKRRFGMPPSVWRARARGQLPAAARLRGPDLGKIARGHGAKAIHEKPLGAQSQRRCHRTATAASAAARRSS